MCCPRQPIPRCRLLKSKAWPPPNPPYLNWGTVVHTAEIGHWAEQYLPNELLVDDLWLNILVMAHVTGCWDELPAEDRALKLPLVEKR
jgi:hypothetical protein